MNLNTNSATFILNFTTGSGPATVSGLTITNSGGGGMVVGGTEAVNFGAFLWSGGGGPTLAFNNSGGVTFTTFVIANNGNQVITGSGPVTIGVATKRQWQWLDLLRHRHTGPHRHEHIHRPDHQLNAGTLSLAGSIAGTSNSTLTITGGTFSYAPTANSGTGNSQTMNGFNTNGGATVNVSSGNTLTLGNVNQSSAGATVNFNSTTTGTITTTSSNNNGILNGPWVTWGSGTSLSYATAPGSNPKTIAAYNGGTAASAGLANMTSTATNYTVTAGTTISTAFSPQGYTLQYTGGTGTIDIGTNANSSNTLTLQGLMNSGTGQP